MSKKIYIYRVDFGLEISHVYYITKMNTPKNITKPELMSLIYESLPNTISHLVVRNLVMIWSDVKTQELNHTKERLKHYFRLQPLPNSDIRNYAFYLRIDNRILLHALVKHCFGLQRYSRNKTSQQMIRKLMKA
jgi:hypothetical protein